MKIAIVDLGYVGLPLAMQFARSGADVLGLDIKPENVNAVLHGRSYIKHVVLADITALVVAGVPDAPLCRRPPRGSAQ